MFPVYRTLHTCQLLTAGCWLLAIALASTSSAADPLRVLFLGDDGPHRPAERHAQLQPVLQQRGIELHYTTNIDRLSEAGLAPYDGLIVYANIDTIEPQQEAALLQFVASGNGFIPLHCASYCFRNSEAYVDLVGAQFHQHGTGTVRTRITAVAHPVMQGFDGFESWDETYIHHRHNPRQRQVLEERIEGVQAEGREAEPWSWVRTHGRGRVFYTAWGHDHRTWSEAGFHDLVERGIRWACGEGPAAIAVGDGARAFVPPPMTPLPAGEEPFQYIDVGSKIPHYVPSTKWGVQGDPLTQMQLPLSPGESQKRYAVPEGFQLRVFASEPQLGGKPIAMNWDARGRLWVCETVDYPNDLQADNRGRDRIRICEDTDGDGRADAFTVFAERLSIPTTLEFHRGGVIVQNGTETLYLKDTDGDDRADERRVLIRGWALGDTHGGVSNFRYGPDNWFWAMQGYNTSAPEYAGGKSPPFRMGFFRFRLSDSDPPEVTDLEFVRSTSNNTWGLGISEEGLIFGSTANHAPSYFMPLANRYYEAVRGWSPPLLASAIFDTHLFQPITDKVRQVDHHGGYTAGAGHALYTARAYPSQWWNQTAFVCGPTGHLVGTFVLTPDGADFRATSPCNLVASDDEWAAPIAAEVGPDGNVWILDWYNYIVQHNPTPQGFTTGKGNAYESDLRDKKHGRVYRLIYTGDEGSGAQGSAATQPLVDASNQQLIAALGHPTMLWRLRAQQLLVQRGARDVVPQLIQLAVSGSPDAAGVNARAMHALWTLDGLGAIAGADDAAFAAAVGQLQNDASGVCRAAVTVLPPIAETGAAIVQSDVLSDADPQVQLAALLKLADVPRSAAVGRVLAERMAAGRDAEDRWLAEAAICAAARHAPHVLQQLALHAKPSPAAVQAAEILADHLARGEPTAADVGGLITALADAPQELVAAVITGLQRGWPRDHRAPLDEPAEAVAVALLDRSPVEVQSRLVGLATALGSRRLGERGSAIVDSLLSAIDDDRPLDARVEAARRLVDFRPEDPQAVDDLVDLLTPQTAPELSAGIVQALSRSRAANVGPRLVEAAAQMTPSLRQIALRTLLARAETTADLLNAMEQGEVQLSDLTLDQQQALRSHPNRQIVRRTTALMQRGGGGVPNEDRQKVVDQLMGAAKVQGDVQLGKAEFVKHCANCHVMGGEGGKVGPDLTGMAVHPKEELLVHILDPNRSVEGNYRTYTVLMQDGRILNGLLASESRTSIELIDAQANRLPILRDEIELLQQSNKSLMPEGFEQQITADGFQNLLAYLTDTGPLVPLSLEKVANLNTTEAMFHLGGGRAERMILSDWSPRTIQGVPFLLIDPTGDKPNAILLHGSNGDIAPRMPKRVSLPAPLSAKAIHLLSGVSGWGAPIGKKGDVVLIVRLHYAGGQQEDHPLQNGVHFADYIRRVDVPGSQHAITFQGGQQMRYLAITPARQDQPLQTIELIKGDAPSAPLVMAVTVEKPE